MVDIGSTFYKSMSISCTSIGVLGTIFVFLTCFVESRGKAQKDLASWDQGVGPGVRANLGLDDTGLTGPYRLGGSCK